jgi:transcriptional regulator with XRE-family HTH domain
MTQRTENAADYQQLGEHIHALRTSKGLGLREAARLAGVDPTWLSRLEQGLYTSPNTQSLARVARGLGVDIEEFYVVLGLTNGDGLPGLVPYLRAKYDLPGDAIAQLDAHFRLLNEKYQPKGGPDGHNDPNPA